MIERLEKIQYPEAREPEYPRSKELVEKINEIIEILNSIHKQEIDFHQFMLKKTPAEPNTPYEDMSAT